MQSRIVLVEDHQILRDGIKSMLATRGEFQVIGEAENGVDAIRMCRNKGPDIVLMDIGLPGLSGIEATIEIMRHVPRTKVIILSMYEDEHSVVSAMRSGARGFVLKKASASDLLDALHTVSQGGTYLSPQVADCLLQRLQTGILQSNQAKALAGLSPRELQILRLVSEGNSSKEIAVMLNLALETVRSYRKTMMRKVGANNVAGLTQIAIAARITQA